MFVAAAPPPDGGGGGAPSLFILPRRRCWGSSEGGCLAYNRRPDLESGDRILCKVRGRSRGCLACRLNDAGGNPVAGQTIERERVENEGMELIDLHEVLRRWFCGFAV
ncbi:hypothetical protein HanXRQr2_Chr17g0812261 [Helianthus annuus]|uniref:Uncharacterized protein n=1 Tax=Helianthus annuus TaxID=4232 RepID=A0A9K3GV18_HELAN|nr:hypothetical protein HanXRQr2_Chr17g0812261 [Helianthus annuus]